MEQIKNQFCQIVQGPGIFEIERKLIKDPNDPLSIFVPWAKLPEVLTNMLPDTLEVIHVNNHLDSLRVMVVEGVDQNTVSWVDEHYLDATPRFPIKLIEAVFPESFNWKYCEDNGTLLELKQYIAHAINKRYPGEMIQITLDEDNFTSSEAKFYILWHQYDDVVESF